MPLFEVLLLSALSPGLSPCSGTRHKRPQAKEPWKHRLTFQTWQRTFIFKVTSFSSLIVGSSLQRIRRQRMEPAGVLAKVWSRLYPNRLHVRGTMENLHFLPDCMLYVGLKVDAGDHCFCPRSTPFHPKISHWLVPFATRYRGRGAYCRVWPSGGGESQGKGLFFFWQRA